MKGLKAGLEALGFQATAVPTSSAPVAEEVHPLTSLAAKKARRGEFEVNGHAVDRLFGRKDADLGEDDAWGQLSFSPSLTRGEEEEAKRLLGSKLWNLRKDAAKEAAARKEYEERTRPFLAAEAAKEAAEAAVLKEAARVAAEEARQKWLASDEYKKAQGWASYYANEAAKTRRERGGG